MNKYDPITLNKRVEEKIQKNGEQVAELEKNLIQLNKILKKAGLSIHVLKNLEIEINHLQKRKSKLESQIAGFSFYLLEYMEIEKEYKNLIGAHKTVSFMKMSIVNTSQTTKESDPEKIQILSRYNLLLEKYDYADVKETVEVKENNKKEVLKNNLSITNIQRACVCGNKKIIVNQTSEICESCGLETDIFDVSTSNRDISKFNVNNKYSYERKVHFKECMNQFQGKQNTTVKQAVYSAIEDQLNRYKLLNDSTNSTIRYEKVTKQLILAMLKELKITKHYEDYILIFHNLTGKKIDDISHIENLLLEDFDMFVKEYDKKTMGSTDRKSFINTRILLFQLLNRRKYYCKPEDFNILKTLERLYYHDEIIQEVFETLGWNYIKLF